MIAPRATLVIGVVATALGAAAGCSGAPRSHDRDLDDSMRAVRRPALGLDLLSLKWKLVTADRLDEVRPQEFATAAVWLDTVYIGSASGMFFAVKAATGEVRWQRKVGSVATRPTVGRGVVYIGTDDGQLLCVDAQTGAERWRYQTQGAIAQPPEIAGDLVLFSNEADQVYGLSALDGAFRWQHKGETPEEYTLRGHAGVAVSGDLLYTGFSDGTMVALRRETGSVAWSTSLKGDADRFVDVDGTPVILGDRVYVTSSSGGVWALDTTTGLVRWRLPLFDAAAPTIGGATGALATDGERLYVAAADLGVYALDLAGNILWRQGTRGGGEPGTPVIVGSLLVYNLAQDGVYLADRRSGRVAEYFDPGEGVSATPTATNDGRLFVMSNRGVLYAFELDQP